MGHCLGCVVYLAVIVLIAAGAWKTYVKAGQPGWAALIPVYNGFVLAQIAGKPLWWGILLLIPVVNVVVAVILYHCLAKGFGYGLGMTLLMLFLPFVAFPLLGFGDCVFRPPQAQGL